MIPDVGVPKDGRYFGFWLVLAGLGLLIGGGGLYLLTVVVGLLRRILERL